MGATAGDTMVWQMTLGDVVTLVEKVGAIHLLALCQAADLRGDSRLNDGHQFLRRFNRQVRDQYGGILENSARPTGFIDHGFRYQRSRPVTACDQFLLDVACELAGRLAHCGQVLDERDVPHLHARDVGEHAREQRHERTGVMCGHGFDREANVAARGSGEAGRS